MRDNRTLLTNINTVQPAGSTPWVQTGGFLNSIDAQLASSTGSATVDIYVSNSGHGVGIKLASFVIDQTSPHDGYTISAEDRGWHFVRGEVSALSGGAIVRQATAGVGE
jgi:hypothetical protein